MITYSDFEPVIRYRGKIAISPDGRHIASIDDSNGQYNIVVQPMAGGDARRLTQYLGSSVTWIAWRPDGGGLIFLLDGDGSEREQLFSVDLAGGEPRALTNALTARFEPPSGYPFSGTPESLLVACAANDRVINEQDVLTIDLASGETRRLCEGGRMYAGHWSPDGQWLSAADWREGSSDHVVYVVSRCGDHVRRLTPLETVATYWLGPWLPDGSAFFVRSDAGRDFTGLALLDAQDGGMRWIDTPDWDVEQVALSGDGRILVWSVNVDGTSRLYARDLRTSTDLALPELPSGVAQGLQVTHDGTQAVMLFSSATRPWSIAVVNLIDGELRWLTRIAPRAAETNTFIEPELVRYRAFDGRDIPAYLYRARGSGPTGVVISLHGGPPSQERPTYSADGFFQHLLANGVHVLAPNVRGSTGYGTKNQKLSYRDWGGGDLGDVAATAEYLRSQPWVDPARIALVGASYGGFLVLSALARLPEYEWAAAVDWFGPSNLLTFTRASPPSWRSKVATMIGDPDADTELLVSRSPITYADQIRAPLFVIQGATDSRVAKAESDQIVERLRSRGVEVRYDVYPNEGHGFSLRENQRKARSDAGEFLLSYLLREA